jgi:hypothetical protein
VRAPRTNVAVPRITVDSDKALNTVVNGGFATKLT